MDKKGQWVHAMAREAKSQERRERLETTKELLKQGFSVEEIAYKLGISGNTVRQYIKEVGHIVDEEKYLEDLQKKFHNICNKLENMSNNLNSSESFVKFVKAGIEEIKIMSKMKKSLDILGYSFVNYKTFANFKKGVINMIKDFYSALYGAVILSLYSSFNNPKNKKNVPQFELDLFNKKFSKWNSKAEREEVLKEDYEEFLEDVRDNDGKDKIENFIKILNDIEKKINLKKNIKNLDESIEKALPELDISNEEIPKRGKKKGFFERLFGG